MTRLILVRHGETIWHAENRYTGSSDIPLTTTGQGHAQTLAGWALEARPDLIVSSNLRRSVDTATPAARALGLGLRREDRLREVHFGAGEGRTLDEMKGLFPTRLAAFLSAPAEQPFPDGETGLAAIERAEAALAELCAERPRGRILLVCHSTLIRLLLCRMLGLDPNRYRSVFPTLGNVALTEVDATDGSFALIRFNSPI